MTPEDLANSANKIIQECEFTNMLQSMIEYGNSNVLTSFKYRLEMESVSVTEVKEKEQGLQNMIVWSISSG